jgi:ABC-type Zn uptake system ZnuABC Zn-binding protein ZnuA
MTGGIRPEPRGLPRHRLGTHSVVALLLMLVAGCAGIAAPAGAKPTVVTSNTVLADLIRNVVEDRAEVVPMVPAGASPHDYDPSPAEAQVIGRAAAFFANGLNFENRSIALVESIGAPSLRVVTLSDGLKTVQTDIDHGDHNHLFTNPYVYLDVRNAMAYVGRIRDTMMQVDPRNADAYRAAAASYLAELEQLDAWIAEQVATIPAANRRFMKDHASFPYYADRYGLVDYAASYEGTEEVQPSASQYAALIEQVRKFRVKVLFGEEGYSSKLLQQLAADTGARFVPGLHAGTLGSTEETDSYIKMMRRNTCLIVENLR